MAKEDVRLKPNVNAGESPLGTPLAKPLAGLKSSRRMKKPEQRDICLYLSFGSVRLVAVVGG